MISFVAFYNTVPSKDAGHHFKIDCSSKYIVHALGGVDALRCAALHCAELRLIVETNSPFYIYLHTAHTWYILNLNSQLRLRLINIIRTCWEFGHAIQLLWWRIYMHFIYIDLILNMHVHWKVLNIVDITEQVIYELVSFEKKNRRKKISHRFLTDKRTHWWLCIWNRCAAATTFMTHSKYRYKQFDLK